MNTKKDLAISTMNAEFIHPQLEKNYRQGVMNQTGHHTTFSLLFTSLYFTALATYNFISLSPQYGFFVPLGFPLVVVILSLVFAGVSLLHPSLFSNGWGITIIEAAGFASFFLTVLLHSNELTINCMNMIFMIMAVYLFIPNRFIMAICTSALASLVFAFMIITYYKPVLPDLIAIYFMMISANIFGGISANRINVMRRLEWSSLAAQKKNNSQLMQEIAIRRQLEERLRQLARSDALSDLNNRSAFLDLAQKEFQRARRYDEPLSLMILDVDFFKRINDNYGHATGDETIRNIGQLLKNSIRNIDIAGRLGGEEFVILLPHATIEHSYEVAERFRQALTEIHIDTPQGPLRLTASIGLALCSKEDHSIEATLSRADKAMYTAKKSGRNQVKVAPPNNSG
ncbi:MAG TPA: diguanylate cyclase [Burkholderiales bacterium]|nr:diguanylate cyclase [Burkholderiales bacterium]